MNYGIFAGRLGRDAEVRETPSGQTVCNFSLAVDTGWGDKKQTLWIDAALWGERAEKLAPFLLKGKQVTIGGDLGLRTWKAKDDGIGAAVTCNVQRVTLQGASQASGESYDWKGAEDRAKAAKGAAIGEKARAAVLDDDIPF